MTEPKLIGDRHLLFLDEAQARGVEKSSDKPDYPNLSPDERRVCDTIAEGLFLSKSLVQWAYFNARQDPRNGRGDAFKRMRELVYGSARKLVLKTKGETDGSPRI